MSMGIAVVLFGLYFLNVSLGAFGDAALLGDVSEMLLLAVSGFSFVVAILKREAAENDPQTNQK
jgi:hypothetical protein